MEAGDMTDQELLQAMSQMMDQKLKQQLSPIRDEIEEIKEGLSEVRTGVNMLINWSEKVSMAATFPLPDIDD